MVLPTLTPAEITELVANSGRKPANRYNRSVKAAQKGGFEGKAGSIVRSRKGATRRLANGQRYYVGWDQVPAYMAKSIV